MTKRQWITCIDPEPMLHFLRAKVTNRKLHLFEVACIRLMARGLLGTQTTEALEILERLPDGGCSPSDLRKAAKLAFRGRDWEEKCGPKNGQVADMVYTLSHASFGEFRPDEPAQHVTWAVRLGKQASELHGSFGGRIVSALLRDIFGCPFTPPTSVQVTTSVTAMAAVALEERKLPDGTLHNSRLAVIADALEEAGCTDQEILGHCRSEGPHVRGCWAVDLLLGKS